MTDKTCPICRLTKTIEMFSKNRLRADGYAYDCKSCNRDRSIAWSRKNRERRVIYKRDYFQVNKTKLTRALRHRRQAFCLVRLRDYLRNRLCAAVTKNSKTGSAVRDLGCSVGDFKKYIEAQFQPGMTWANWSKTGWHLDHKIPLSKFDLTDATQLKHAVHFTNLQPLWATDNLRKGNRV